MTEPARVAALLVLSIALSSIVAPQASAAGPAESPATSETAAAPASPEQVRSALADGDLSSAREQAIALREADPSFDNLLLEAEVHERLADYEQTERALTDALAELPEDRADERASIEARLAELEQRRRGTVPDEPASSERERIDAERAERLAAAIPAPTPKPPVDQPPKREPIVKKWYFWVTLTALVATAGAITGVAINSAVNERDSDAASRLPSSPAPSGGAVLLRF